MEFVHSFRCKFSVAVSMQDWYKCSMAVSMEDWCTLSISGQDWYNCNISPPKLKSGI